jgi:vancomycin resistance protein YoaR
MSTLSNQRPYVDEQYGEPPRRQLMLSRLTLVVVSILILINLVTALLVAGYQVYYDGLIFPGVSVWGVDLSGMTPSQAAAALNGQFHYPQTVTITFRDGQNIWPMTAGDLGVQFDIERTVQAAYEVGRHPRLFTSLGQQFTARREGVVVSPVVVFDQRAADQQLQQIAAQINRPAIDAQVVIESLAATATPSQIGRTVDMPSTLASLGQQVVKLQSGEVNLVVIETPPQIGSAEDAAALVNTILAEDLEVKIGDPLPDDPGPWVAPRDSVAGMLLIEPAQAAEGEEMTYTVRLDEGQLEAFLTPLAPQLARDPSNARFVFDEESGELQPIVASVEGRRLDVPASIQMISQAVIAGEHDVPLVFETIEPAIADTSTAQELGITGLISSATTYYRGSSQARRSNIQTAASRFHGIVVEPGQEFSFNHYLGDVSLDSGFEQALIIYNGRTIEGVGGGTCQVSTTVFQAAFYAGFPINERWSHGYRVGYYEVGEGAGMDATVYAPLVDLRFTNDTDHYLLIESYVDLDNATLTFRFYGTSDGRTVQKEGPVISNIVPHGPPLYEENPELSPGQTRQVDYAVDGADVTVYRTVYRDGEVLYQDTFLSQYVPWQAIYQVAPGYAPAGAKVIGGG